MDVDVDIRGDLSFSVVIMVFPDVSIWRPDCFRLEGVGSNCMLLGLAGAEVCWLFFECAEEGAGSNKELEFGSPLWDFPPFTRSERTASCLGPGVEWSDC